jgi:hypothetical protein
VAHFLEGLKEENRSVIAIHRPQDMDIVCALALMQEEEADSGKRKSGFKTDHSATKSSWKITQSANKGKDTRMSDEPTQKGEDKVASLLSYRKAKGLCFKCGDKWSKGHTCPAQVPLQIIEEMMMVVQQSGSSLPSQIEDSDSDEGMELMEVNEATDKNITRIRKPTMRLLGCIGKQQTLILVDSGSAATFINTALVEKCGLPVTSATSSQYTAADGA